MAVEPLTAYVANESIPTSDLPKLLEGIYGAIFALASARITNASFSVEEVERPTQTQIRKSVRDDGIVSFIDGKAYQTLKRHLSTHGLDPSSYWDRYGLPADYPMVAPSYAARWSALAKAIGLGRPGARQAEEEPEETARPNPRGRRKA